MKTETPPRITFLMLPHDLILSCLARVSRSYYPTLSLVSKRFHSILNSPELYTTRSLLDRTESCLYVCLQSKHDSKTHWFILFQKPNQTAIDSSKTNGNILVPILSLDSLPSNMSSVVSVGSNIYTIGGSNEEDSSVFVIDSHSHTWCKTSSMHVARVCPCASVMDGKIFVTKGCQNLNSENWMEVFDTKTRTWEFAPSPNKMMRGNFDYESIGFGGSIYVMNSRKADPFKLNKGRWRRADLDLNTIWLRSCHYRTYCVIENVLYCYYGSGNIQCYDCIDKSWRYLYGIEGLPEIGYAKLVDYGGKIALLWEEYVISNDARNITIWCAQISLEKRQRSEIHGTVEWFGVVFTNSKQYKLMHVLSTTA